MFKKTELQKQLKELEEKCKKLEKNYDEAEDRKALAGKYLQAIRGIADYTGANITSIDFDRVLDVLEQDRYFDGN